MRKTSRAIALAVLALSIAASLATARVHAQQTSVTANPDSQIRKNVEPKGTVHGKEHPELIPDLTAYRFFFIVAAIPSDANEHQVQRQHALLGEVGLSPIDQLAILSALSIFHGEYATFLDKWGRQQPDNRTIPERDGIVTETIGRLRSLLTPNGVAALDRFIQQEKTKITRVAAPHAHHAM